MQDAPPDLNVSNLAYVEELYDAYLQNPNSVSDIWKKIFADYDNQMTNGTPPRLGPSFKPTSIFNPASSNKNTNGAQEMSESSHHSLDESSIAHQAAIMQERLMQLVRAYRVRGHLIASVDPLDLPRPPQPELFPAFYGFSQEEMNQKFSGDSIHALTPMTLRDIVARLKRTYCEAIGVQYMHIDDLVMKVWLEERMEITENKIMLTHGQKLKTLTTLTDAVILEEFIQRKFVGSKSFSLEGSESIIPLLHHAIETAGEDGVEEVVLSMAHRGRLNVLVNIMGKSPADIFREFADKDPEAFLGRGDVKYHKGYSSDWKTVSGRNVHLSLCFNPSHLEFVNPVALGRTRAKQDRRQDKDRSKVLTLVIHGDAAFAGEGVVQETLNLSELTGYQTGGTLHVIINNQIGFTTDPSDHRSCTYATDVGKMLQIPIFHVNGENPEAVAQVVRLASEFRRTFQRDVIIDMYSFRRLGHNEGDEPAFTQPVMYRAIRARPNVREGYLQNLLKPGGVTQEEAAQIAHARKQYLETQLRVATDQTKVKSDETLGGSWRGYYGGREQSADHPKTRLPLSRLSYLLEIQTFLPDTFTPHAKLKRILEGRGAMARGERKLDWGAAEALAFASLLIEGTGIRLTGQDSQRGTFSHRHSVLHDFETGESYMPLRHLDPDQAKVEIHNSPLTESAVLAFEYGFSMDMPDTLCIWEAQFGDFANVAQVIFDQFISSGEDKWQRLSGLVVLLPHAFEGMGPEHSSARLERFLNMAAEDNMQICYPSTPSQCFHMFRRQALRKWTKPLIVMSPKSLLRHPKAVSSLEELAQGSFHRILPDQRETQTETSRILICSGKIYYELDAKREELGRNDVAILRIEQFYPLPQSDIEDAFAHYGEEVPVYWVQDEPENMGAWRHLRARFGHSIGGRWPFYGIHRPESASPATGSFSSHKLEQTRLLDDAFASKP
ncbi:MAG: 2-oxoglutarate dehydrogenase E1 component [Myxococcota bacterium]|nr:2-oxoglutarate dehydrogenase E1 component [Myxococcota bacterium]